MSLDLPFFFASLQAADDPFGPDTLSHLSQVRAAALGMGQCTKYGDRPDNQEYFYMASSRIRAECPGLFSFLNDSNGLRYLFLAAPILYYQKNLLPCWTKSKYV